MLDELVEREPDLPGSGIWSRLRGIPVEPVPHGLLDRCLETTATEPIYKRPAVARRRWLRSIGVAAAALLMVGVAGLVVRPGSAAASQFLKAAGVTWSEVPACHITSTMKRAGEVRTEEVWYVRDKGGRHETRRGDKLIGVVVANSRWEFRWDVEGSMVAAWSRKLLGNRSAFESASRVLPCESMLAWAEKHRAEIKIEADSLDGVAVRKVTLRWPSVPGARPQVDTFWFEPESLRPVQQRSQLPDGSEAESRLDYPAPENVPADLLAFRPPADAILEVNDPDLGRQVYSEGRSEVTGVESKPTNGEKR
ncbi:MAG: hypothetical protein P4L85_10730 [Paludisphaera borealis]|uniref:hypothetical protein n=1 Tax=Paludisphaera borealis TaxID=1387353 RepID=UPI00283E2D92|nr:hypothetical protein [Paludisphaera borealis]MDR3619813.1 hypothetical protein [Paludisphaera borealis]